MHQNGLFITHFRHLAICLTYMATREMGNKKTILREKKTKHHPFPARKKQKQKLQNKFMFRCFPTEASKKAEDATRARQQERRGGKRDQSEHRAVLLFYTANSCDIPRYENR